MTDCGVQLLVHRLFVVPHCYPFPQRCNRPPHIKRNVLKCLGGVSHTYPNGRSPMGSSAVPAVRLRRDCALFFFGQVCSRVRVAPGVSPLSWCRSIN